MMETDKLMSQKEVKRFRVWDPLKVDEISPHEAAGRVSKKRATGNPGATARRARGTL